MIKRQQGGNGCQTTILRNKHMTTRNCYYFTRTFLCKSRLTHIFNHTRYPLSPPLLLHTRTHSTMQVRKEIGRGIANLLEMFNVVCSKDVNIPHAVEYMICDVHFGDTRYDLTPVRQKWLPNDHTEEQTTTTNNDCDKDDQSNALHIPNTIHFRPSQRLTLWNSGKMRTGKGDGEVLFCCGRSDDVNIPQ